MTSINDLRARADLLDAWERYELGDKPPAPMDYKGTASMIREAADALERSYRDAVARFDAAARDVTMERWGCDVPKAAERLR